MGLRSSRLFVLAAVTTALFTNRRGVETFGLGEQRLPLRRTPRRALQGGLREEEQTLAEPALGNLQRQSEWREETLRIGAAVVGLWTGLDCALDPGVDAFGDPAGLLRIALPTALLVAPGAAVAACARLAPKPEALAQTSSGCCAVFVGDSLTQGTVSANFLQVLAARYSSGDASGRAFVNAGMNMRPLSDALAGDLLEEAAAAKPSHGVVILLGTNDLIRYTALPEVLRQPAGAWLQSYAAHLREAAQRIMKASGTAKVILASPPPLGEDLESGEAKLGEDMATVVRQVASELGCRHVPLFEAVADHLRSAKQSGALAARSRAYSLGESLALLCALPWRLYAGKQSSLLELQDEQGLELTVDLVHYGPRFAGIAAELFAEALELDRV